ncbi:MAG: DNA ligase D [Ignavibacteria bacterium]|nr:DNA ligase D [Ignavibacteria bacterium]
MRLSLYKKKRNFKETPEPADSPSGRSGSHKFIVQKHDATNLHYDFRLEMEGVLKSWAVPKGPSMNPADKRLAIMVEDHPLDYENFFGIIPKGNYGAGLVEIWDRGTYKPIENPKKINDEKLMLAQLKKGDLKIDLNGHYLNGTFALVRMNDGKGNNWLLIKKKDEYSEDDFNIEDLNPVKIYKGKEDKETKQKKKSPNSQNEKQSIDKYWKTLQKPMLAKLTDKVFDDKEWIYEIKFDGYRSITKIENGKAEMVSRNGHSFNEMYKPLVKELENIKAEVILDGEVVIENKKGIPDFQLLQNYSKNKKGTLKYFIFDILFLNGHDLTGFPLYNRKELLEELFKKYKSGNIFLSVYAEEKGTSLFDKVSKMGYEGIIAKDKNGIYRPGKRSDSWLKIKTGLQQEAIICGYTLPQGSRKHFGSLILGLYENENLKYIGNCGTGFSESSLKELFKVLNPLVTAKSPFSLKPKMTGTKGKPVWVKPELICDVKFSEWTNDGSMRHPVFNGLRKDKSPENLTRESGSKSNLKNNPEPEMSKEDILTLNGKKVKVTNTDKLYWKKEKITKGDLIKYYTDVSKYILPYLKNRPESLNRHPNGIDAPGFYQKDMDVKQIPKWAKTVKIYSTSNKKYIDYLICNDAATLIYMANLGCIEINPWNSVYTRPDNPDYMILDLDPGDISFKEVIKTALVTKEVCDEIGVKCYCKTSGATGLHVYLPLKAKYDYDQVRTFANILASVVHDRLPDTTSIERSVSKRKKKIYVDFLQNSKGQTIAAPYSVRPRPLATVSTPLMWSELKDNLTPQDFTILNIKKRLDKAGDLWKGVLGTGVPILKALKKLEKL